MSFYSLLIGLMQGWVIGFSLRGYLELRRCPKHHSMWISRSTRKDGTE